VSSIIYETRLIQEAAEAADLISALDIPEDANGAPIVDVDPYIEPATPVFDELAMDQLQTVTSMAGDAPAEYVPEGASTLQQSTAPAVPYEVPQAAYGSKSTMGAVLTSSGMSSAARISAASAASWMRRFSYMISLTPP
jgi:hypothetical protein